MNTVRPVIVVILGLAFPGATRLAGQTIQGIVVSEDEQRVVSGASVVLIRDDGAAVDSTVTSSVGRFRLQADSAGLFVLHTRLRGYASYTSNVFRLRAGEVLDRRVELPLVSVRALEIMADVIGNDSTLQRDLPAICGEELRPWESGIIVGVVRDRYTREPIPGALVMIAPETGPGGETPAPLTTVSNDRGSYILCNVPLGESPLRVRADGKRPRQVTVQIRAGMISWYDVLLYPSSRSNSSSSAGGADLTAADHPHGVGTIRGA